MIAANGERPHAGSNHALVVGLDILERRHQVEARAERHVADIGDAAIDLRRHVQRMMIRPDAFDRAQRARPKTRARSIGNAKIHRHADQRDVQIGEAFPEREIQECRHAAVWQAAFSSPFEQCLEQFSFGRIVSLVRRHRGVLGPQPFKLAIVHSTRVLDPLS